MDDQKPGAKILCGRFGRCYVCHPLTNAETGEPVPLPVKVERIQRIAGTVYVPLSREVELSDRPGGTSYQDIHDIMSGDSVMDDTYELTEAFLHETKDKKKES